MIIATVSPHALSYEETMSTLDYANRFALTLVVFFQLVCENVSINLMRPCFSAKSIKNKPEVNQKMTQRAYIRDLAGQIAMLKKENEALRTKNGIILHQDQWDQLQLELNTNKANVSQLELTLQVCLIVTAVMMPICRRCADRKILST